ncbi:MAG: arylesterase [Undibacterium sp.]|nr:arylesterase [Undibacterium sp.]
MAKVSPACALNAISCKIVSSPVASLTRLLKLFTSIAGAAAALAIIERSVSVFLNFKKKCQLLAVLCLLITSAAVYPHSAPKTILVLGDSLSAEYGLVRGTGWVALLEKRLAENHINAKLINASISGETTSGGKARLAALLKQHQAHILIIELGGNDALRGLDLAASEKNFREMLAMAKAAQAKSLLVAMRIPPNYGKTYSEQFFAMYAKIAKENQASLVPFFLQGVADKPELFQADRIHLKAEAHPIMLDNVWAPLQILLKK